MKYKIGIPILTLSVLLVLVGGHVLRSPADGEGTRALPLQQASVTVPGPGDPVVVAGALSPNTRGLLGAQAAAHAGADGIPAELVDAYTLAVALSPAKCHLSVSLLAAIGQVESGNLEGRTIDAGHRAVPAVLGPVLDGTGVAAIKDTDDGRWDGNRLWDQALGPLQLVPASWRVVGLDMDADGIRDPQDVYDAAGAAMVYLCADARDLGTSEGLNKAVMAYNHAARYLKLVLAWKAVFDAADITGLESGPALGAWAMPDVTPEPPSSDASVTSVDASKAVSALATPPREPTSSGPTAAHTSSPSGHVALPSASPGAKPSASSEPSAGTGHHPKPDPEPDPTCSPTEPAPSGEPSPAEPSPTVIVSVAPDGSPTILPDPCLTLVPSPSAAPTLP
jgi:hypothetical protein